jgi:hypothetical protein
MADAVEKGLRLATNSDSAFSDAMRSEAGHDGSAEGRSSEPVL